MITGCHGQVDGSSAKYFEDYLYTVKTIRNKVFSQIRVFSSELKHFPSDFKTDIH